MKKIFSSWIGFLTALIIFLFCTYWIYRNANLEDLTGEIRVEQIKYNESE